jgi:hypothetical protein
METELDDVEVSYPEVPEPTLPVEPDDLLFDSERDYFDQLEYYQDWRNGSYINEGRC